MAFSPHANFAKGFVTVAPSPASSGTSFTIDDATQFPSPGAVGYPLTVWPAGAEATPANAEIVLAATKTGNVFSGLTRAYERSTARAIQVGDQVGLTITAGILEAIEGAIVGLTGSDQQVVFFDGVDNPVGNADLTFNKAATRLILGSTENGNAEIVGGGLGTQLTFRAADGDASHVGGELTLQSGNSNGQSSGNLSILTGADDGGGDSGAITIVTGIATDGLGNGGDTGDISISVGNGAVADGSGGQVSIQGGAGRTGGGSVFIAPGARTVSGSHGTIQMYSADSNKSVELSNTRLYVGADLVLDGGITSNEVAFGSLPVSPAVGQLANISDSTTNVWGATIAGTGGNHVLARWNGSDWTVVGK